MGYKIAVVGATGNVGREMLNILAEREFPVDEIVALASRRSLGSEVSASKRLSLPPVATRMARLGRGTNVAREGSWTASRHTVGCWTT